jgi:preprotein translocase subunit YajC
MLWRPQSKRAKEQKEMIDSVQKGDEIVMTGGMLGKIHDMSESYFTVIIAEGINVTVQKNSIHAVLPKGTITAL